ncbi:hypothetical protein IWQ62_003644 [Dispira parvispora]|uniref:Uncharacterized protein n=1 Tax=Dispira parvispora TaxID=1520584 RepID=A0A9W8E6V8_9FUNG|nr:hypothetical protein IWQ62_003644 [Dispira parvispora]
MKFTTLLTVWAAVSSGVLASPTVSMVANPADSMEQPASVSRTRSLSDTLHNVMDSVIPGNRYSDVHMEKKVGRLLSDDLTNVRDSLSQVWKLVVPHAFDDYLHELLDNGPHHAKSDGSNVKSDIPVLERDSLVEAVRFYNQNFDEVVLDSSMAKLYKDLYNAYKDGEKNSIEAMVYFLGQCDTACQNMFVPQEKIFQHATRLLAHSDVQMSSLRLWMLGFHVLPHLAKIARVKGQLEVFTKMLRGSPLVRGYKFDAKAKVPGDVKELEKVFDAKFLQAIL